MSASTMYVVREDGACQAHLRLRNSHGSGPLIWTVLVERYEVPRPPGAWDAWENLWDLVAKGELKLEWWEYNTLAWTYDNAMLRREDFHVMAASLRRFAAKQPQNLISHGESIAQSLEKLLAEPTPPEAACMWVTNLSDNPWGKYDSELDDEIPYNIRTGTKHWFIDVKRPE